MSAISDIIWNPGPVLLIWLNVIMLRKLAIRRNSQRAQRYLIRRHQTFKQAVYKISWKTTLQQLLNCQTWRCLRSRSQLVIGDFFGIRARPLRSLTGNYQIAADNINASQVKQVGDKRGDLTMPTNRRKTTRREPVLSSAYTEVTPIADELLDRCNLVADTGREQENSEGLQVLDAIGDLLKTWRIGHGFTRAMVAEKLDMTREKLLFLETGMSMTADISVQQLTLLQSMLAQSAHAKELTALLEKYAQIYSLPEGTFTRTEDLPPITQQGYTLALS